MDFSQQLTRRFLALNRRVAAFIRPDRVNPDGHGTYIISPGGGRASKSIYVNPTATKSLMHGKNNRNLDSKLRL